MAMIAVAMTLQGREWTVERMLAMPKRDAMQLRKRMPRVAWSWTRRWLQMCPSSDTIGSRVQRAVATRSSSWACGYGLGRLLRARW